MTSAPVDVIPTMASFAVGIAVVMIPALLVFPSSSREFTPSDNDSREDTAIINTLKNNLSNVAISQERTPCLGPCPSYSVNIYGNGTVSYGGGRYVKPVGTQTLVISNSEMLGLVAKLDKTDFFLLKDGYGPSGYDIPYSVITISVNGNEIKRIVFLGGERVPEELVYLRNQIEKLAGITS